MSNIIKKLEISKFSEYEPFAYKIEDETTRVILKYKNHPSIIAIENQFKNRNAFYFTELEVKDVEKQIQNLQRKLANTLIFSSKS